MNGLVIALEENFETTDSANELSSRELIESNETPSSELTEGNEAVAEGETVNESESVDSAELEEVFVEEKVIDSKDPSTELVVPPQASAMDLVERGNIDFTGDMSLDIPLLTVNGRNGLDLPLIAHYKSGVKVKQEASLIGLGWNLEIGSVTRIPLNVYDFNPSWNGSIYENGADPIPDAYLVSTPTGSRKFYNYAYESGNPNYAHENPKFMSTTRFLLEDLEGEPVSLGNNTYDFSQFIYYAEDGTRYVYGLPLKSSGIDYYSNGNMSIYAGDAWPTKNTKWLLTAILSADYVDATEDLNPLNSPNPATDNKGNWIAIEYYPVKQYHYAFNINWQEFNEDPENYEPPLYLREMTYPYRIVTPTHIAEFTLEDEFNGEAMSSAITLSEWKYSPDGDNAYKERLKRLKEVKLYNYSGSGSNPSGGSISEIGFYYYLEGSSLGQCNNEPISGESGKKTTLESIKVKSSGGTNELPSYDFEYYSTPAIPCAGVFGLEHRYEDMFGYYCLRDDCFNVEMASSYAYGWAGSLKKIYYPNGTLQEFVYSNDSFSFDFGLGAGEKSYFFGGVKTDSITIIDAEGDNYIYTYNYGDPVFNPEGIISGTPSKWLKYIKGGFYDPYYNELELKKYYPFLEDDSLFYVYYSQVEENLPGANGRIERGYNFISENFDYEIRGNGLNLGEWYVNGGNNPNNGLPFELVMFSSGDLDGERGRLESKAYYDEPGNLVKEVEYQYNRYGTQGQYRHFGPESEYVLYSSWNKELAKTIRTEYDVLNPSNYSRIIEERWYSPITPYYSHWNDTKILYEIDTYEEGSNHKRVDSFYPLASDFIGPYYDLVREKHMYSQPHTVRIEEGYGEFHSTKKWKKYEYTQYDGERLYLWKERDRAKYCQDEWIETIYSNYDDYGNVGTLTDPLGNTTTYVYEPSFNYAYVQSISNALGQVTSYTYHPLFHSVETITDPNQGITTYGYDAFGRVNSIQKPLDAGPSITYHYSVSNNQSDWILTAQKINGENTLTNVDFFDGLGRNYLSTLLNHDGRGNIIIEKGYDSAGRLWKEYKPYYANEGKDYFSEYQYYEDPLSRIYRFIPPGSNEFIETSYGVIDGERITTVKDEKGQYKRSTLDEFNNLVKLEEDSIDGVNYGNTTIYEYDILGNLVSVTDAENHYSSRQYNFLGRLIQESHPDSGITDYVYDDAGNLKEKISGNGTTTYYYDALNRLTLLDYPEGTDTKYYYDGDDAGFECLNGNLNAVGMLCAVKDASGKTFFGYDGRGRITIERKVIDGMEFDSLYTYDSADNIENIIYPNGTELKYNYNELNQLAFVEDLSEGMTLASYDYKPNYMISSVSFENNIDTSYEYYPENGLKSISTAKGKSALFQRSFEYDEVGNLEYMYDSPTVGTNLIAEYDYDNLNRIETADIYSENPALQLIHSYDRVGNRKSLTNNGSNISYTYEYESGTTNTDPTNVLYFNLDEGEGSTAYDSSGNENNGSIQGAEWVYPGYNGYGSALSFDGDYKKVEVNDNESLDITEGITLAAWFKLDAPLEKKYTTILDKNKAYKLKFSRWYETDCYHLMGSFTVNDFYGYGVMSYTCHWEVGEWYHVAFTYDRSMMKIYINGVLETYDDVTTEPINTSDWPIYIGNVFSNDRGFAGTIDEVKIYNRALNEEEILGIMNPEPTKGSNRLTRIDYTGNNSFTELFYDDEGNLVKEKENIFPLLNFNLDEGEGGTAYDSSGNENNGSIQGAEWVEGKEGTALRFNESSDRVIVNHDDSLNYNEGITISSWIKFETQANEFYNNIISKPNAYILRFAKAPEEEEVYLQAYVFEDVGEPYGDPYGINSKKDNWNVGEWYHVAFTYDRSYLSLYVNGALENQEYKPMNTQNSTDELIVGNSENGVEGFPGTIDEVKLFNKALTENEIFEMYNSASSVEFVSAETNYLYNHENQLIKVEFPDGEDEKYFYDYTGRRVKKIDRDGLMSYYVYDLKGNLVYEKYQERERHWICKGDPKFMEDNMR